LRETPSSQYAERTQWNVRDSDGTVVFSIRPELKGGSLATAQFARDFDKPVLHLFSQDRDDAAALELLRFIQDHRIKVLNVAGPRASDEPGVAAFVRAILEKALVAE
jgi:hypothetical protein